MCEPQAPVWTQTTKSGFNQRVFIMYHSTTSGSNAYRILQDGFNLSHATENMLGAGIYASRTLDKSIPYGPITFKMLVYPGRVARVNCQGHQLQKNWHEHFGCAWVPANCGMVQSGREENCIKSNAQVRILGVVRGWSCLTKAGRSLTRNLTNRADNSLDAAENEVLGEFLSDLGLRYAKIWIRTLDRYLADHGGKNTSLYLYNHSTNEQKFFWTKSWDSCIENMWTGRVLYLTETGTLCIGNVDPNDRYYKWKLDKAGALINKGTRRPLALNDAFVSYMGKRRTGDFDRFAFVEPKPYGTLNFLPVYEDSDYSTDDSY